MTITLSVGATTVTLPVDLIWSDEFDWQPVRQNVERSLTGALIIDIGGMTAGRPISLHSVDRTSAWMTRVDLLQVQTWANTPGLELELNYRGVERTVIFRHQSPPALSAEPVVHFSDIGSDGFYLARINLMEV